MNKKLERADVFTSWFNQWGSILIRYMCIHVDKYISMQIQAKKYAKNILKMYYLLFVVVNFDIPFFTRTNQTCKQDVYFFCKASECRKKKFTELLYWLLKPIYSFHICSSEHYDLLTFCLSMLCGKWCNNDTWENNLMILVLDMFWGPGPVKSRVVVKLQ